mmetsp:Transcript_51667/g.123107  ORF Transcript_51667/g.123107 Transcript_51667/m.123107 type:complete len:219 (+) Transcript_51667:167-823(+)
MQPTQRRGPRPPTDLLIGDVFVPTLPPQALHLDFVVVAAALPGVQHLGPGQPEGSLALLEVILSCPRGNSKWLYFCTTVLSDGLLRGTACRLWAPTGQLWTGDGHAVWVYGPLLPGPGVRELFRPREGRMLGGLPCPGTLLVSLLGILVGLGLRLGGLRLRLRSHRVSQQLHLQGFLQPVSPLGLGVPLLRQAVDLVLEALDRGKRLHRRGGHRRGGA